MTARHRDTQFSFRINAQLLAQAQQLAEAQRVPLSQVITAALQDYVRYGTTRPPPPEKEQNSERLF